MSDGVLGTPHQDLFCKCHLEACHKLYDNGVVTLCQQGAWDSQFLTEGPIPGEDAERKQSQLNFVSNC